MFILTTFEIFSLKYYGIKKSCFLVYKSFYFFSGKFQKIRNTRQRLLKIKHRCVLETMTYTLNTEMLKC